MFNVFQRVFGGETLPNNRVIEIRSESLGTLQILARDEAMVLFAPAYNTNDKKGQYDIVLQRPTSESTNLSFSLYRTTNLKEAEDRFNAFLNRLPQFVSIVKEFYNIQGLQKVCDILAENPSWSLTHLVAYFNLTDYVNNPKVLQCIDYPDHVNFMSPLQLAIRCGNLEMVKALLPLSKIDHLDSSNQSVFHYAANSNKEIINLLAPKSTVNLNYRNNEGYTPLHMACLSDKPECVAALLLAGADPNACVNMSKAQKTPTNVADFFKGKTNNNKLCKEDMKYGGTPLHWCCSRETLNALIMSGCDVNATNFKGRTALHDMVERNRLECVVSLLAHEAEVDRLDNDLKSPLHIAIEKRLLNMVQCLVVFGANLNLANKDGMTPRHMAAQQGVSGLHVILYILHSVGAKRCGKNVSSCSAGCSFDGDFNGIPPEAPEMAENREHIENMLASTSRQVFTQGALDFLEDASRPDTTIINTDSEKKGQSMMDALLAMFTTKVYADSKANTPTGSTTGKLASGASSPQKSASSSASTPTGDGPVVGAAATTASGKDANYPHGRGRVLCLDGGGIRGLVLAQMLMEIENMAQVPIVHLFDWIAGTSTGGILALGIGSGMSVRQLIGLYMRMKEQCFVGSRPYNSELFENILKENLGEMAVMTDIKNTKVMVTAVMADRKPVDLHLFRNYTSASDILGIVTPINNRRQPPPRPEEQLVWRAARASGAAPSYFRAFGRFLDGGLVANNPTLDALTEIHEYNMALRSVGRDSEAVPRDYERMNAYNERQHENKHGLYQWASQVDTRSKFDAAQARVEAKSKGKPKTVGPPIIRPTTVESAARDEPMYTGPCRGSKPIQRTVGQNIDLAGFIPLIRETYNRMVTIDTRLPRNMPFAIYQHAMVEILNAYLLRHAQSVLKSPHLQNLVDPLDSINAHEINIPMPIHDYICGIGEQITPAGDKIYTNLPEIAIPQGKIVVNETLIESGTFGPVTQETHNVYECYVSPYVTSQYVIESGTHASHASSKWNPLPKALLPNADLQPNENLLGYKPLQPYHMEAKAKCAQCTFDSGDTITGRLRHSDYALSLVSGALGSIQTLKICKAKFTPRENGAAFIYKLAQESPANAILWDEASSLNSPFAFSVAAANRAHYFGYKRKRTVGSPGTCYFLGDDPPDHWEDTANLNFNCMAPFTLIRSFRDRPSLRTDDHVEEVGVGRVSFDLYGWTESVLIKN